MNCPDCGEEMELRGQLGRMIRQYFYQVLYQCPKCKRITLSWKNDE